VYTFPCEADDVIILLSDGVHANLSVESLSVSNHKLRLFGEREEHTDVPLSSKLGLSQSETKLRKSASWGSLPSLSLASARYSQTRPSTFRGLSSLVSLVGFSVSLFFFFSFFL
jgi:hypothetical protein